ncbi:hypothetical protein SAMD00019534_102740 [Acytostelium subglobosum LB1]|uniref:hypothetical protein n=1 Tax=Acytostelium subglobosum LB1 TaxID=1410327 RepID=UPI000644979A|nr:hypothetical protein SAMD00019534_102740 [Acytostelium subglobosum LB1]GAM27099.1 hypothetical protein SAMD00019534_102740 [Acytostelium subglobosum LB1]|eukprot:XP_012749979.1 hypothetical protein SAMD00019534_102740 [Acytostelium subglobosum LB1]
MTESSSHRYLRTLVSGKKKRFVQDGFNLDLSYITERIIAMGYPADNSLHKMIRNDIDHVYNFFETYHKDHWKIVNVAQEISYSHTKLCNNVLVHGFEDHTPPPFLVLLQIIDVIHAWLSEHEDNVVAIHCKAGKGRTGTCIASYLALLTKLNEPDIFYGSDSILSTTVNFFSSMRSISASCVNVPSQRRYIGYYISYLKGEVPQSVLLAPPQYRLCNIEFLFFPSNTLLITSIEIHNRYDPRDKRLPLILHVNNTQSVYVSFIGYTGATCPGDNAIGAS